MIVQIRCACVSLILIYEMIDKSKRNGNTAYTLASCEYQICTGDMDNKNAARSAVFFSVVREAMVYTKNMDNVPQINGGNLTDSSESPNSLIHRNMKREYRGG